MAHLPTTGDVANHPHIEGRVCDNHGSQPETGEEKRVGLLNRGIAADHAVVAGNPDVAGPRHHLFLRLRHLLGRILVRGIVEIAEETIKLCGLEAGDGDIKVKIGRQLFNQPQLVGQDLEVPAGVRSDLVVGDRQRLLLRLIEMRQLNNRNALMAELACRLQTAMPGNKRFILVNENGRHKAKGLDAPPDLPQLRLRVRPRIARVRLGPVDRPVFNLQVEGDPHRNLLMLG